MSDRASKIDEIRERIEAVLQYSTPEVERIKAIVDEDELKSEPDLTFVERGELLSKAGRLRQGDWKLRKDAIDTLIRALSAIDAGPPDGPLPRITIVRGGGNGV